MVCCGWCRRSHSRILTATNYGALHSLKLLQTQQTYTQLRACRLLVLALRWPPASAPPIAARLRHRTAGQRFTDILGSPFYLAPEVISKSYGREADVWSLGCILYQMIAGQPPFYADDDKAVFRLTQRATPDLASEPWPGISAEAKDLLERILVKAPHARITLQVRGVHQGDVACHWESVGTGEFLLLGHLHGVGVECRLCQAETGVRQMSIIRAGGWV